MSIAKTSSLITPENTEMIEEGQPSIPTWPILIFLIIIFFIFKKIIYSPDPKKDGK